MDFSYLLKEMRTACSAAQNYAGPDDISLSQDGDPQPAAPAVWQVL